MKGNKMKTAKARGLVSWIVGEEDVNKEMDRACKKGKGEAKMVRSLLDTEHSRYKCNSMGTAAATGLQARWVSDKK